MPRATPNSTATRARIIEAAVDELAKVGLTDWTVEEVARRAGCAKGLVLYHFQSKRRLLSILATQVRTDRAARLAGALSRSGAGALDDLWEVLVQDVRSNSFRLWLSMLAERQTTGSATIDAVSRQHLVTSAATALSLPPAHPAIRAIPAFLDGLQLQLLMAAVPEDELREQYDGFWLDLLKTTGAG